ncbi:PAS domain-containing hybrid sensor histidine kinase/response regulator [Hymenobacter sp. BT559]|uniref:PAS domain-containing hybrid sensor histidine kinase/response regulator n=1 Tax=Hymenobacter sp. BT559 TaxID=2795729 RepID=UPI0018EA7A03|nr:PAS domain-containing hybrid sensor histidine kinase/response regulator [Hymenobacter sp. BT559]MBJ6142007.1 response regulator [Hymenobacter sp. BT559]
MFITASTEATTAAELADLRRQVADLQLLANLPEHNPNPILRYDAAGRQLYANPAALSLRHGLSRAEQVRVRQALRDAAKAGLAGQPTAQLQVGSRYFQLSVVATMPPAGSVTLYLAETTGRILAEEQLLEQQAFINDILATMPNLVHVRDAEGTLVFENRAATELRAKSGHLHPTADHPPTPTQAQQLASYRATNAQVLATGEPLEVESHMTLNSGQELYFHTVKRLLVRADGTQQVLGVSTDITDRRQAECQLTRAKQAAEAAVLARENFLANMSHEMRTPLNGVLGMAAQLARTALTARQQEFLRTIRHSGQHLLGVINDVLDMAKITSGKLELEESAFNICDSMHEALQPLVAQAQDKGIRFSGTRLQTTCSHPWVLGDALRLNQILLNLVANAIKFTEPGGSVVVVGEQLSETDETLTVRFSVEDSGIGIAPDKQELIFEGFTQAYADTTRRFGGTGLGLSISRALVAQLGGALTLCSTPGQGSIFAFVLTLPKAPAPLAEPVADAYDTGALRGRRVLVIEDNEINRTVARLLLEGWGVEVEEAEDGLVGVARVRDEAPYDLILMDIQMPGLNGLDATAAIRALPDPLRANCPIVALTANAFRADCDRYLSAGMAECLAKPFDEEEVYHTLVRVLPPPSPAYDLTKLRTLARGREAFVVKIIRSFLQNMPGSLAQLANATAAAQWPEAAKVVHHIKPSLESLGIREVEAAVLLLEQAQPAAYALLPAAVMQLTAQVQRALDTLPKELGVMNVE